jgi:hypothetical protein
MGEIQREVLVKYVDSETGEAVPRDKVSEKVRRLAPEYRKDAVPDLGPEDDFDCQELSEKYGICGAETADGTPCMRRAGTNTDHFGFGRCHGHDGVYSVPATHGRYSKLRGKIKDRYHRHKGGKNPLDITDEIAAMRALFETFISDWRQIREDLRAWNEAEREGSSAGVSRPRRLPALRDGFEMLQGLSKVAQRQQQIDMEDAVSRRELRRVLQEFARVVEQEIPKDIPEDLNGDELIRRIKDGWNKIHIY